MSDLPAAQPERWRTQWKVRLAALRAAKAAKGWVGAVLNLAGLAGLVTSVVSLLDGGDWTQTVLAGALAVLTIGFAVPAYSLQLQFERTQIDARGAVALRSASTPLAKAANMLAFATSSLLNGDEPAVFKAQAQEFARELAAAYTAITGAKCRVTVKQTYDYKESGDLAVRTLFSSDSVVGRVQAASVDLVKDNTDFFELLNQALPYWLSPDITTMPGYVNSHYSREEIVGARTAYRSVLVWPIRVVTAESPAGSEVDLLGFLCVDSAEVGIFDEKRDVSPGEILSHSLYPSLRLYKQEAVQPRHRGGLA